jgi:hypothetical protein
MERALGPLQTAGLFALLLYIVNVNGAHTIQSTAAVPFPTIVVGNRSIYLYHARKAGGTSLRSWLKNIPNVTVQEGQNLVREKDGANEIWITSIRDPIHRIISSYKYEGRWNHKSKNYTPPGVTFDKWVETTQTHVCKSKTWSCSENCFTRWFSGCSEGLITDSLVSAAKGLAKFDVIVDVGQLHVSTYVEALEKCIGHEGFFKKLPYNAHLSNRANELHHAQLGSEATRANLEIKNQADRLLLAPYIGQPPC